MTKIITTSIVLDLLEAAVEERGADYHYHDEFGGAGFNGCRYEVGGKPACIAGVVLEKLGVPSDTLKKLDYGATGTGGYTVNSDIARKVLSKAGFEFEDNEPAQVLREAQQFQDAGGSWGFALDRSQILAERLES